MSQEAKDVPPGPSTGPAGPAGPGGPEPGEASWPGPYGLGGPGSEELPMPRGPAGSGTDRSGWPGASDPAGPSGSDRSGSDRSGSGPSGSGPSRPRAWSDPAEPEATRGTGPAPGSEETTETEHTIRTEQAVDENMQGGPPGDGDTGAGEEAARQRDEYLDALRRLQAEFDNYRKRMQRQQRETVENAAATLVKKLLPVLDTADLALAHGGGEDVKQVGGALFDILSKEGLERIDPEGQPFDPVLHDAVAHEPVEGQGAPEMPEVSEVLRAGYLWKGQVLRPAMVKVRG
jgi:molecular chaperone GrpE